VSSLHVEIRGTGPDLVLLHGWALHGGMWGPWLDRLAQHARLHVIDLPGHGHSPWRTGITDLGGLASCVLPLVPHGAAVLGWSLGGMIALELARQHPRQLGSLVLVATTPRFVAGDDWAHGMRSDVLEQFARGLARDYRGTVHNFLALQALGDEHATQALRALRSKLATHGEPDPRALDAGLGILRDADLRDGLTRISHPVLVIAGEHDRLTPPDAGRELAMKLPSARFSLIRRAGHAPFLSHADEVLEELLPFLERRCEEPSPALRAPSPAEAGEGEDGPSPALAGEGTCGGAAAVPRGVRAGEKPSPALRAPSPALRAPSPALRATSPADMGEVRVRPTSWQRSSSLRPPSFSAPLVS
jgi:pimeloyl-[acyl-carrier protein] methyl ester esterase